MSASTEPKNLAVELREHAVDASNQPRYDDEETRRLLRRVDYRLMPVLTFLYLVSFLDRGNIGNARVAGMNTDLKLSGGQFNLALTVRESSSLALSLGVLIGPGVLHSLRHLRGAFDDPDGNLGCPFSNSPRYISVRRIISRCFLYAHICFFKSISCASEKNPVSNTAGSFIEGKLIWMLPREYGYDV